ncbi:CbtA family protein [Nocardioides nitrophenolicus]|uniref:CbtA family protein n=1 Tax=Nocardioides nitrophenolicus TaxID=60489 RepID=UPI00195DB0C3|nr:CbtA family protein [Nocardioides nitrophenolicus]MBM7516863.1 putative cobalt transporter CbtA [Nocardioides nitrophenolicus]
MSAPTLGRTVGNGALAGAVAGGLGAAALNWLVEPSIRAAIAIEEAGSVHEHAGGATHDHGSDALVSRPEQVVLGLVTVLVVGILVGIAFALVHRFLGARLPGRTPAGTTMTLAGLGFVTFTLAPALVVPANPPAVGDPATVDLRTVTYLGTIVCAVALAALVIGVARSAALRPGPRAAAAVALGVVGTALLVAVLPHAADPIPGNVPADLVWEFRVASLAQIGLMWLAIGATCAWLDQPRADVPDRARQLVSA